MSNRPYDDAFKTLMYECPYLLVPIVNRLFRAKLPRDAQVDVRPNEFLKRDGDDDLTTRILDGVFRIMDRLYHIEIQTDADGSIVFRVIEYDFLVAGRSMRLEDGVVRATFPRSAVIGLRCGAVSREPYRFELGLPDGSTHSCEIPTLSIQDVTNDEIFDEDLYFLIPFVLFRHERELDAIAGDQSKLKALDTEIGDVRRRLEASVESGRISSRSADIVLWLLDYVSRHLAKKQPEIAGRVREMGGEVLEIPFLRERDAAEARAEAAEARAEAAEARGRQEGMQQGRQLGMLDTLFGLVRDGILGVGDAAQRAGLSANAFNAKMAEYEARPQA